MSVAPTATRQVAPPISQPHPAGTPSHDDSHASHQRKHAPGRHNRQATDDEILGIDTAVQATTPDSQLALDFDGASEGSDSKNANSDRGDSSSPDSAAEPESVRAALDANPELRRAWQDAQAYRETFATPEEARAATGLLADLDRMDALFFSRRPEDHAELARAVSQLDSAAFASLAQAMSQLAGSPAGARNSPPAAVQPDEQQNTTPQNPASPASPAPSGPTQAQTEFFHAANAAAVQGVLDAIESQVERLLPEGVSKSARNRVVGEIYRELDTTLRSNRQLSQQMREAFRSGALDADHQRAIVSLVRGRARQALPGVAKRVLNEWTSTIVTANHDRRARQRAAERRVDIAGSGGAGNDGRRPLAPRDIDYARMSDSDILNM